MAPIDIQTPATHPAARSDRRTRKGDPALAAHLRREIEGKVLFDPFSRGRYATDASIYQIEPVGVVVPAGEEDVVRILQIAAEHGVPVTARGAGTSQCGQTVNESLVIDTSRHLDGIVDIDPEAMTATVQPGVVLDELNRPSSPTGSGFPSTCRLAAGRRSAEWRATTPAAPGRSNTAPCATTSRRWTR